MEIKVRNVNAALSTALNHLHSAGIEENSRNGPVIVVPEPVITTYSHPRERVLFSKIRDANPLFFMCESLWMLGGRNDVAFVARYNSRIGQYSDDAVTFHGAYGHRWRKWFGYDQLDLIVQELQKNPDSRRAVLAMWDASMVNGDDSDLSTVLHSGLDIPCNTHIYFDLRGGKLNMTVCCRSNDALWGAYGANAVHFSVLQEYLAFWLETEVGVYRQFSNNLHIYKNVPRFDELIASVDTRDLYVDKQITPKPLISSTIGDWEYDLFKFLEDPTRERDYNDAFFAGTAAPMALAWQAHKAGRRDAALALATDSIDALDWSIACREWLERRYVTAPHA